MDKDNKELNVDNLDQAAGGSIFGSGSLTERMKLEKAARAQQEKIQEEMRQIHLDETGQL